MSDKNKEDEQFAQDLQLLVVTPEEDESSIPGNVEKIKPPTLLPGMTDSILKTLGKLDRKISSSPALNGGFELMMVKIDHISEKQATTSATVDKIHDALYEPDNGFFSRVKTIETNTIHIKDELLKQEKKDEEIDETVQKHKQTTEALTKIAGTDLHELSAIIKLKKTLNRLFWVILAGGLGEIAKLAWEYYQANHQWAKLLAP